MKRLNDLSENTFLKIFFLFFSLCFLVAAFFMPDRADMLSGYARILRSPAKASANYFSIGGFTANLVCILLLPILAHHFRTKQQRLDMQNGDAVLFE